MKELILTLTLILMSVCVLSACTKKEPTSDNPTTTNPSATTTTETDNPQDEPPKAPEKSTGAGYTFAYKGKTITLGEKATDLKADLGEPTQTFESPSCAFEGTEYIYYYPGIQVNTYPTDGVDYVLSVTFADDSVTTTEGVYLGMTEQEVRDIYGTPDSSSCNVLIYVKDGTSLKFIIEEGKVADITYYYDDSLE
jgi:hypothetical protein